MLEFHDINFDCRLYNGYKPCIYGNHCPGCPHYQPEDPAAPGWQPVLTSGAVAALTHEAQFRADRFPQVLIIKTGALGDVLRTTTLLSPLKRALPGAHVTWITAPGALPLLAANRDIDLLLGFDDAAVAAIMAAPPPDLLICLEKEGAPLALAGRVNSRWKTGYVPTPWNAATGANEEAKYMVVLGVDDDLKFRRNSKSYPHIICEAVGLPFARDPYVLNLTERGRAARAGLASQLEERRSTAQRLPVVGLNTGCGEVFRTKQWTADGWAGTAAALSNFGLAQVVIMGGPAETGLNREILERVPAAIDAGTDNPLEEFFGIVDACDIVVTADTLGMHVAIARQKYVVALFGSTSHTEIDLYDSGEKIITDFPCSPCYLKICDKNPTCMQALGPAAVVSAVQRGLASLSVSGQSQSHDRRSEQQPGRQ